MDSDKQFCPYCGSVLTTKENEGRLRSYCQNERRIVYENPIPAATALLINNRNEILLVLRNREPGLYKWGLPGGFVENGESPAEAAKRELKEETGLTAYAEELINVIYEESNYYKISLLIIGYRFDNYTGILRAGDDADRAAFFKYNELPELAFGSHRTLIDQIFKQLHQC